MDLPLFHERNSRLLKEAECLLGRNQIEVGESDRESGSIFYALGSFYSNYLGKEVYGGVKKKKKKESEFRNKRYFLRSLTNLLFIEELCPELKKNMPLFFGAIKKKEEYTIFMEDYSRNRTFKTEDFNSKDFQQIPDSIKEAIFPHDECELLRAFIKINDSKIKMMDFDTIPWNDLYSEVASELRTGLYIKEKNSKPYLI